MFVRLLFRPDKHSPNLVVNIRNEDYTSTCFHHCNAVAHHLSILVAGSGYVEEITKDETDGN